MKDEESDICTKKESTCRIVQTHELERFYIKIGVLAFLVLVIVGGLIMGER